MEMENSQMKLTRLQKLLTAVSFSLVSGIVQASIIEVNTFNDQDGEDDSSCSLREAVHASLAKKPYGGCTAGKNYFVDTIKLQKGTYQLDKEIEIIKRVERFGRSIKIFGANPVDYMQRDDITGQFGKRETPETIITTNNSSRAFNTSQSGIGLTLIDVGFEKTGVSTMNGGAFLIGGSLTLENVFVKNSQASAGGVVYLEGKDSSLSATNVLLENNTANQGAVVSQSCQDNLYSDKRNIKIENASIVKNTATSNKGSTLYACGAQQMKLTNVTFAQNNNKLATLDMSNIKSYQSGDRLIEPKIELSYVTMVKNDFGLAYNEVSGITIKNSVIAYNTKDCQYFSNTVDFQDNKQQSINFFNNLLLGDESRPVSNSCQIQAYKNDKGVNQPDMSNIYVNDSFGVLFETGLTDYGLGLLGYMPKNNEDNPLKVFGSENKCSGLDKRGISRGNTNLKDDFSCFIGSINTGGLFAVNDLGNSNEAYADILDNYKDRIEQEQPRDIKPEDLKLFNDITLRLQAELHVMKKAFIGEDGTSLSRVAIVNILNNDQAAEIIQPNGSKIAKFPLLRAIDNLDEPDNYQVTVDVLGTASDKLLEEQSPIDNNSASNLVCKWLPELGQLIAYRKDSTITPAGKYDWCRYKVTHTQSGQSSSAYVQFKFINQSPRAENITIETDGYEEKVRIDLTTLVDDNNDGAREVTFEELYLSDNSGNPVYVEITEQPEVGKLVFLNDEIVDCPIADKLQTESKKCHVGQLDYVRYSNMSGFGDTFKYKVYDCGSNKSLVNVNTYDSEGEVTGTKEIYQCDSKSSLSSNEALVTINARTDSKKDSILVGGGSSSYLTMLLTFLLMLTSLYGYRRN